MKFLSAAMIDGLLPAETLSYAPPAPTQLVSSDDVLPVPRTPTQCEVESPVRTDRRIARLNN